MHRFTRARTHAHAHAHQLTHATSHKKSTHLPLEVGKLCELAHAEGPAGGQLVVVHQVEPLAAANLSLCLTVCLTERLTASDVRVCVRLRGGGHGAALGDSDLRARGGLCRAGGRQVHHARNRQRPQRPAPRAPVLRCPRPWPRARCSTGAPPASPAAAAPCQPAQPATPRVGVGRVCGVREKRHMRAEHDATGAQHVTRHARTHPTIQPCSRAAHAPPSTTAAARSAPRGACAGAPAARPCPRAP
jgi:hypothetical protein